MKKRKTLPLGVKIISILYYVCSVLVVIGGIIAIGLSGFADSLPYDVEYLGIKLIFGGIFAIIMGIVSFFVAKGLWNLKNWARIVVIIFAALGILDAGTGIARGFYATGFTGVIVDIIIAAYLIFSEEAKKAFA
tara:strand:- start:1195 stop:1596 length:402 start_codon:yes stop_codon:yes gene_type:complete